MPMVGLLGTYPRSISAIELFELASVFTKYLYKYGLINEAAPKNQLRKYRIESKMFFSSGYPKALG